MSSRRALIFGAGQIGQAVEAHLHAAGWQVTVHSRSRDGFVRQCASDIKARVGSGADLLIDTIGYGRADADVLLTFTKDIGALVTISSASVYADATGRSLDEAAVSGFPMFDGAILETQSTVSPGDATYSTRKVAMEQRLLDVAQCPVTVLRPCAIHGLASRHPREWWFVKRLLDGRSTVPLAYGGDRRFHTTAAANIAALVGVVAQRRNHGILNIGDDQPPSVAEIGKTLAAQLGCEVDLVQCSGPPRGSVGRSPWCVPHDYLLSNAAAEAIGYASVGGYPELIAPVVAWLAATASSDEWKQRFPLLAAYPYDLFDYAAEDAAELARA